MATYIGKIKVDGTNELPVGSTLYGTCTTAKGTVQKDVTLANFDKLVTGVTIHVKFTNSNTASSPTLKVGSTDAKAIKRYGTTAPGTSTSNSWNAGAVVSFTYDGSYWVMNDFLNTTYSNNVTGTGTSGNLAKFNGTSTITDGPALGNSTTTYLRNDGSWATPSDTDTWRNIKVDGTEILGTATNTGALNLKAGSNVTLSNSSGEVTIAATDTTYENKAAASGGTDVSLVTTGDKYNWNSKVEKVDGFSGTTITRLCNCTTGASTAAKVATSTSGTITLEAGTRITVFFTNKNTAPNPTLNVDGTGAKSIYYAWGDVLSSNAEILNGYVDFVYDGVNNWQIVAPFFNSKSAVQSGTDVSLVTTGEKYDWNNKTSNTGTVTQVTAGVGLNTTSDDTSTDGGDITTSGTLYLTKSGVTAGTYQGIEVDKYGRVTSASDQGYTTNTGTVTSVATGVGLTGGPVSTSGTIKAKLKSETALTADAATVSEVANRIYPVVQDLSGNLAVSVPWVPITDLANTNLQTWVEGLSDGVYVGYFRSTTTNRPSGVTYGSVLVVKIATLASLYAIAGAGRFFTRSYNNGTWVAWKEVTQA